MPELKHGHRKAKQTSSTDVYLGKVYNVLLSTDKPIYQPGQTIRLFFW